MSDSSVKGTLTFCSFLRNRLPSFQRGADNTQTGNKLFLGAVSIVDSAKMHDILAVDCLAAIPLLSDGNERRLFDHSTG
jgi:hypothetical protein